MKQRKDTDKFPVEITLQVKATQSYLENMIQCTIQSAVTCRKYYYEINILLDSYIVNKHGSSHCDVIHSSVALSNESVLRGPQRAG